MRVVYGTIDCVPGAILVRGILDIFTEELFFTSYLIGAIIVTELTATLNVTPAWLQRHGGSSASARSSSGTSSCCASSSYCPPEVFL